MAIGVLCKLSMVNATEIAGTSRWMTALVASGVTSRRLRPVPPVVKTRSTLASSEKYVSSRSMMSCSSGMTMLCNVALGNSCLAKLESVGPEVSLDGSVKHVSLTVTMAIAFGILMMCLEGLLRFTGMNVKLHIISVKKNTVEAYQLAPKIFSYG